MATERNCIDMSIVTNSTFRRSLIEIDRNTGESRQFVPKNVHYTLVFRVSDDDLYLTGKDF